MAKKKTTLADTINKDMGISRMKNGARRSAAKRIATSMRRKSRGGSGG